MSDYTLTLVTAPTPFPIEVGAAKKWLRVDDSDSDGVIQQLIAAATDAAERFLGRQLLTATWRVGLRRFPTGLFRLPKAPLQSITSVTYYDSANVLQTLDSATYIADAAADPGTIELAQSYSWPSAYERPGAVRITFVAGYATPQLVPKGILLALEYAIAQAFHVDRGDGSGSGLLTAAVRAALAQHWTGCLEYGEVG